MTQHMTNIAFFVFHFPPSKLDPPNLLKHKEHAKSFTNINMFGSSRILDSEHFGKDAHRNIPEVRLISF